MMESSPAHSGDLPDPPSSSLEYEPSALNVSSSTALKSTVHGSSSSSMEEPLTAEDAVSSRSAFVRMLLFAAATFQIAFNYVVTDSRKHKRSMGIGIFTVFLVVCFLGLIQNAILRSAVIFVHLAERQVGQYDVVFTPSVTNTSTNFFFNYTQVNETLTGLSDVAGTAPRWVTFAEANSITDPSLNASIVILVIDTDLEASLGIGSAWTHRALGANELHLTASTCRALNVKPNSGDQISVTINFFKILSSLGAVPDIPTANGTIDFVALLEGQLETNPNFTVTIDLMELLDRNVTVPVGVGGANVTVDLSQLLPFLNQTTLTLNATQLLAIANGTATGLTDLQLQLLAVLRANFDALLDVFVLQANYYVIDCISSPGKKYPVLLGNVATMDLAPFQSAVTTSLTTFISNPLSSSLLSSLLNTTITPSLLSSLLSSFRLSDYSLSLIAMLSSRQSIYVLPSLPFTSSMITATNHVGEALSSSFPGDPSFPVASGLSATVFLRLFLDQVFNIVVGVLVMLAVLLIYSLLLSDVEDKTFEYGMLRSLGLPNRVLIGLLGIQAAFFSVPGILTGFLLAFIIYVPVDLFFSTYADFNPEMTLASTSVIMGIVLGIFMPVVGMVVPIRRALSRTLRDSLDKYHNTVHDSIVTIRRLTDIGFDIGETFIAILMVVIGVLVYYVIPLSFLFNNLAMFFNILMVILLGMIVGQVMVTQVAEHPLETMFVYLIMWGKDRILANVVITNLSAHRSRNRKTAVMFTLCLGFVVFAATLFALQAKSIPDTLKWASGADIVVATNSFDSPLPESDLRSYLDTYLATNAPNLPLLSSRFAVVSSYAFATAALDKFHIVTSSRFQAVTSLSSAKVSVYAVDDNFLDVAYDEYIIVSEERTGVAFNKTRNGAPDVIRALYADDDGSSSSSSSRSESNRRSSSSKSGKRNKRNSRGYGRNNNDDDIMARYGGNTVSISSSSSSSASSSSSSSSVSSTSSSSVVPLQVTVSMGDKGPARLNATLAANEERTAEMYARTYACLFSEAMRSNSFMDTNTKLELAVKHMRHSTEITTTGFLFKGTAMLRKIPGFADINRLTASGSGMIITNSAYMEILSRIVENANDSSVTVPAELPKATLFVRVTDDATPLQIEGVVNGLNSLLTQVSGASVTNLRDVVAQTEFASQMILLFFDIVAVIGLIFCFCVLWLSFTANVRENAWEYGVLRAIGLDALTVMRLYIYEAVALVLACVVLGTAIGILTAVLLTLQSTLFTDSPFVFYFPGSLYALVVILSFVVAIIGSYIPTSKFRNKEIAIALRGL